MAELTLTTIAQNQQAAIVSGGARNFRVPALFVGEVVSVGARFSRVLFLLACSILVVQNAVAGEEQLSGAGELHEIIESAQDGTLRLRRLFFDETSNSFVFEEGQTASADPPTGPGAYMSIDSGFTSINGSFFYSFDYSKGQWNEILISPELFTSIIESTTDALSAVRSPIFGTAVLEVRLANAIKNGADGFVLYCSELLAYIEDQFETTGDGDGLLAFWDYSRSIQYEVAFSHGRVTAVIGRNDGAVVYKATRNFSEIPKISPDQIGHKISKLDINQQYRKIKKGLLGFRYDLTREAIVVVEVIKGSLAESVGLMAGDKIRNINGLRAADPQGVEVLLNEDTLEFDIERGGEDFLIVLDRPTYLESLSLPFAEMTD